MPKGGGSRLRPGGNGRLGLRDIAPELRAKLEFLIANPAELAALPEAERITREQQIGAMESTRRMRSAAARRGHLNRRKPPPGSEAAYRMQRDQDVEVVVARLRLLMQDWGSSAYTAGVALRAAARLVAEGAIDGTVEVVAEVDDDTLDEGAALAFWLRADAREAYCSVLEAGIATYEGFVPSFIASVTRLRKRLAPHAR